MSDQKPADNLERKIQKPRKKRGCLRKSLGCLTILGALGTIAYLGLDSYLSSTYSRDTQIKTTFNSATNDFFKGKNSAQKHLVEEYFQSLPKEFWDEMKNYDLLEKKVLDIQEISPDKKIVYFWVSYQNQQTQETETNIGTFEMVRQGGKWKITSE